MTITLSNRDAVHVGGASRLRKRVNSELAGVPTSAANLLIAGPATGAPATESAAFIVSADGQLSGTITVSLSWGGVPCTPSATSVTLSPSSPTASVTAIPSITGTLTLTATAAGLSPATAEYAVVGTVPTVDFNLWSYKIDPALPFEASWGTSPDNGGVLQPRLQLEFDADTDGSIHNVNLNDTTGLYDGIATNAQVRKVNLTATQAQKGSTTPSFPVLDRIADPAGGGFTVFKHRLSKAEHPWAPQKKWRAGMLISSQAPKNPWGTVLWSATAFYFDSASLSLSTADNWEWNMFLEHHQGSSSRIRGGGLNFEVIGGNGDPTKAGLMYCITRYENPNWLAGDYSNDLAYIKEPRRAVFMTPPANQWIYFITQTRLGCGYADPTHGPIYGSLGPFGQRGSTNTGSEYFVKMWHAVGSGAPVASFAPYYGYWGGPHNPAHAFAADNVLVNGVLTNRTDQKWVATIYGMLGSQDTEISRIHRGVRVWRHQEGMDPIKVLEAFRG